MGIERFLLLNAAMDFAVLASVSRAFGTFRLARVLPAALGCAAYGALAAVSPGFGSPLVQLALLGAIAAVISGSASRVNVFRTMAGLACCAAVAGAAATLPPVRGAPLAGICGAALFGSDCAKRRDRRASPTIRLTIETPCGRTVIPRALIDTGNRLREPLSGQPVIIAPARLLGGVIPEGGFRLAPYGTVGGSGALRCFRPSRVTFDDGRRVHTCRDVWVALFPGGLPGGVQALAPSAFALSEIYANEI